MSWGKRRQDTRNTRGTSGSRTRGLAGAQDAGRHREHTSGSRTHGDTGISAEETEQSRKEMRDMWQSMQDIPETRFSNQDTAQTRKNR